MSDAESSEQTRRVIVEHPDGNSAGLAVRRNQRARDGERVTVEQLWSDGSAEPVYVGEENVMGLIKALAEVADER